MLHTHLKDTAAPPLEVLHPDSPEEEIRFMHNRIPVILHKKAGAGFDLHTPMKLLLP